MGKFNPSPEQIRTIFENVVDLFLIPNFEELGMNASGEWRSTVEVKTFENRVEIWARDYTPYLEYGRGANADQSPEGIKAWVGWAGSTFLAQWVQDKGLSINPYAVAYKIAREGTTWKEKGGSNVISVLQEPHVTNYINEELRKIYAYNLNVEITSMTKKAFA